MKYILEDYPDLKEKVSSMTVEDLLYTVAVPEVNPASTELPRNTAAVFMQPVAP